MRADVAEAEHLLGGEIQHRMARRQEQSAVLPSHLRITSDAHRLRQPSRTCNSSGSTASRSQSPSSQFRSIWSWMRCWASRSNRLRGLGQYQSERAALAASLVADHPQLHVQ